MGLCYFFLTVALLSPVSTAHPSEGLCTIAYEYCGFGKGSEPGGELTPEGEPAEYPGGRIPYGPQMFANYSAIGEEIALKFEEAERKLEEKLEEYNTILEEIRALASEAEDEVKSSVEASANATVTITESVQTESFARLVPSSCDQVHKMSAKTWNETGGLFEIYPNQLNGSIDVYCDLATDDGRWTVFQRRMDGSVSFYRGWDDYANGFGDKQGEFWLGLETIRQMTAVGNYELRIDMEDWDGNTAYAKYSSFSIGDSSDKYRLSVKGYSGTAGESMITWQDGKMFTTIDSDNDPYTAGNCAILFKGAWWHNECHKSNLNGFYTYGGNSAYGVGINWKSWKGYEYSLKFTEMKFRRN